MSDLSEGLEALSEKAGIAERNERMQQLRADFKTVWASYRSYGYLSQDEYEREFLDAGKQIKGWLSSPDKISPVMDAYRTKAAEIERDRARSVRIAAEVRAERAANQVPRSQAGAAAAVF